MKKKYLAALLSATIVFTSMPTVPILANPIYMETEFENSTSTEEIETSSFDFEENSAEEPTVTETINETIDQTESPSTEIISETEELFFRVRNRGRIFKYGTGNGV